MAPSTRRSPGLAALFEGIGTDAGVSVLDLGEGSSTQLEVLAPYARVVRFAGLTPRFGPDSVTAHHLRALAPHPQHPYDVVLAWGILDHLDPADHALFVRRMCEITAPGARLYASVDAAGRTMVRAVRSTLVAVDRVAEEAVGPELPAWPPLLPAPFARLLVPFQVDKAFTLRTGLREYVAVKREVTAGARGAA